MRLFHITSPSDALSIVECGVFYPVSEHRLNNDNGLNCFDSRPNYWNNRCEGYGARLLLEWTGPVEVTHRDTPPPLKTEVLHDQHPWRCFIRGGTSARYLRVVGIRLSPREVNSLVLVPGWHQWLPARMKKRLFRKYKLAFFRRLRNRLRTHQLHVRVHG
jgi:hypothetical protein